MISSPRIHLLSPLVANQIAAGEVIERPASVLKELLENSLDAGADELFIDIEKSGKQLIRVRDNGGGIHPDDLSLALHQHATSKIALLEDLEKISSLGFRGEALASIRAVSDFRLVSAQENSTGFAIHALPSESDPLITPAAHPVGTTVEVRELFINTPVRRRFLRSDKTEWNHILETVHRIALSRHNVAISLKHNGEIVLQIPAATTHDEAGMLRRVKKIVGSHALLPINEAAVGFDLHGWVNAVEASHAHTSLQYFFLNGRAVSDKVIGHAIRVAAQAFLPPGRYAAYVLYLQCDPQLVDVNVHPTKQEVRFEAPRLVHDFLVRALERTWGIDQPGSPPENFTSAYQPPRYASRATSPSPRNLKPRLLALTHDRYLITEVSDGLWIIDVALWKQQQGIDKMSAEKLENVLAEILALDPSECCEPLVRKIVMETLSPDSKSPSDRIVL